MHSRTSTIPIAGLISAEFLSLLGNQVAAIIIPMLVYQQTGSSLITGIAVAGNSIPIVIAAFIGGRAIDRFGAWPVSVISDLLSSISVLALPLTFMIYPGTNSPILIFFLVFIGAFFDPTGVTARHTMVAGLTRLAHKRPDRINTLRGALENAADFIGPAIAAWLVVLISINYTFFANAASFLFCAIIFVVAVPKKWKKSPKKPNNNILFGMNFIFKNGQLKILAITGIFASVVIAAFLGLLLLLLATKRFHNPSLFGICISIFGISATLSALSFSKLRTLFSYSFIYYSGLLMMGVGIALCGIVTTQYGVMISAALAGLNAGNPLEQTILQEETPQLFAGQVFGALPAIRFAAASLGLLLAGLLTEYYNVDIVLVLGGSLLILTVIFGWYFAPLKEKE